MAKHKCIKADIQATCCTCGGRLHNTLCTSKMSALKDCCPARHILLYKQGQIKGIHDTSQDMLNKADIEKYIINKEKPANTWYDNK